MTEKPILFSAPMVRAILAGAKTQTRRVVKPQPSSELLAEYARIRSERGSDRSDAQMLTDCVPCLYGSPGTRLWVRETWGNGALPGYPPTYFYRADDVHSHRDGWATPPGLKWRPSIHMPRAASRITLEVTGVRVERLQDISEADAMAEGIQRIAGRYTFNGGLHESRTAVESYRYLWESINGTESWSANSWVWVVEFRRVTP